MRDIPPDEIIRINVKEKSTIVHKEKDPITRHAALNDDIITVGPAFYGYSVTWLPSFWGRKFGSKYDLLRRVLYFSA